MFKDFPEHPALEDFHTNTQLPVKNYKTPLPASLEWNLQMQESNMSDLISEYQQYQNANADEDAGEEDGDEELDKA